MEQIKTVGKKIVISRKSSPEQWGSRFLHCMGAFVLGGATLGGQALPLGASLIGAQTTKAEALATAIGAVGGYFLRQDRVEAVEYTAVSILVLLTLILFQGTSLPGNRWFMAVSCGVICTLMTGVGLLGTADVPLLPWLGKAVLGALATYGFRQGVEGQKRYRLFLAAAVAFSLSGTGKYIDLGLLWGALMVVFTGELFAGAVIGAALELGGGGLPHMTLVMVLPWICCKFLGIKKKWLRGLLWGILTCGMLLLLGEGEIAQWSGIGLGTLMGLALCRRTPGGKKETKKEALPPVEVYGQVAEILEALGTEPIRQTMGRGSETERVFHAVGERVCRKCTRLHYCWETEGRRIREELLTAAPEIIERGFAEEKDFTAEFKQRCCSFPAFLACVNGELEKMLCRRKYEGELRETRRILDGEYRMLAQFMRRAAQRTEYKKEQHFIPYVSVSCARKAREPVCGDRNTCFSAPDGNYYVILCDGMGTGEEAARLGSYTMGLLEKLLKCGLSPEGALSLLNGNMILRGTGTFSTVDLLQLDLHNGMAHIYKWGAAPSFWKDRNRVGKVGTPTPPPGVGIGDVELPEVFTLPMDDGQLLVMISDGAYCEETEGAVGAFTASSPRDLAALLVGTMEGDDDMTAIVVSLERNAS